MNLEKVAELVGGAIVSEESGSEAARLKDLRRKRESWGGIAGIIAFGLALLLFVVLVVSQMVIRGGGLAVLGSILILLAVAAGAMVYFLASAKSLEQKLAKSQLLQPSESPLVTGQPTGSPSLPPASVTEQTTKLLDEPNERSTHEIAS